METGIYKFRHERKGTFLASILEEDKEWYFVRLESDVTGLVTEWEKGERVAIRKSLVRSKTKLPQNENTK